MKKIEKTIEFGGRKLTLTSGTLAEQASGAVLARYGETVVLATVVAAPLKADLGYFPLTVEYQERLYAGGRIKGSRWVKREGRPSDNEVLCARLIDRSIRPLFPEEYGDKDVQVIVTVLSVDLENDPAILSAVATSAALASSEIPWKGPVGTLKVGMRDGTYFTNPLASEAVFSDLDLVVSATKDAVVMIEAGANEVTEERVLGAIDYAKDEALKLVEMINSFAKEVGVKKEVLPEPKEAALKSKVKKLVGDRLEGLIEKMASHEGSQIEYEEIKGAIIKELTEENPAAISMIFEGLIREKTREMILSGKRPDGRKNEEIRKLSVEVGVLPRVHGSSIFQRGQTQVLTVTTLGAPSLEQLIESAEGEESKRYIHHYSMPPYATGETGKVGYPSRREIGHGALAERALEPVIPVAEKFPYTIRLVSEVMSSNGSTSMASTCGSTLSLMDAGVPIKSPVSGIAMGLVIENEKKFAVLSDILGMEDHMGDMDFKVAGTEKGITALQLDVKTLKLTPAILKEALKQAREGRLYILKAMLDVIPKSRVKVSTYAPKIRVIKVSQEKIGEVIGPGGRMIKKIIAETGAQVDIEDDGSVNISGTTDEAVSKASEMVESLTKEVAAGEVYEGTVKRIQPFGAFVEILPGKDGLVHVSDMSEEFVKNPEDVVKIGDKVTVRVKEIDNLGRINLSMVLNPDFDKKKEEQRGFRRRERPSAHRSFAPGGRRFDSRSGRPSGPHFPTSRFLGPKKDFNR